MKYYRDVDYYLYFLDFPSMGIPGAIFANTNGTANIYINTLYCEKVQRKTIKHELRHLVKNHFYIDTLSIEEKELDADDVDDPSCSFADDFSWIEYTGMEEPVKIPNIFRHPPGLIPVFNSLDILRDYLHAMREQEQSNSTARGR